MDKSNRDSKGNVILGGSSSGSSSLSVGNEDGRGSASTGTVQTLYRSSSASWMIDGESETHNNALLTSPTTSVSGNLQQMSSPATMIKLACRNRLQEQRRNDVVKPPANPDGDVASGSGFSVVTPPLAGGDPELPHFSSLPVADVCESSIARERTNREQMSSSSSCLASVNLEARPSITDLMGLPPGQDSGSCDGSSSGCSNNVGTPRSDQGTSVSDSNSYRNRTAPTPNPHKSRQSSGGTSTSSHKQSPPPSSLSRNQNLSLMNGSPTAPSYTVAQAHTDCYRYHTSRLRGRYPQRAVLEESYESWDRKLNELRRFGNELVSGNMSGRAGGPLASVSINTTTLTGWRTPHLRGPLSATSSVVPPQSQVAPRRNVNSVQLTATLDDLLSMMTSSVSRVVEMVGEPAVSGGLAANSGGDAARADICRSAVMLEDLIQLLTQTIGELRSITGTRTSDDDFQIQRPIWNPAPNIGAVSTRAVAAAGPNHDFKSESIQKQSTDNTIQFEAAGGSNCKKDSIVSNEEQFEQCAKSDKISSNHLDSDDTLEGHNEKFQQHSSDSKMVTSMCRSDNFEDQQNSSIKLNQGCSQSPGISEDCPEVSADISPPNSLENSSQIQVQHSKDVVPSDTQDNFQKYKYFLKIPRAYLLNEESDALNQATHTCNEAGEVTAVNTHTDKILKICMKFNTPGTKPSVTLESCPEVFEIKSSSISYEGNSHTEVKPTNVSEASNSRESCQPKEESINNNVSCYSEENTHVEESKENTLVEQSPQPIVVPESVQHHSNTHIEHLRTEESSDDAFHSHEVTPKDVKVGESFQQVGDISNTLKEYSNEIKSQNTIDTEKYGDITSVEAKEISGTDEKTVGDMIGNDEHEEEASKSKVIDEMQQQMSCQDNTHLTLKSDDFKKLNCHGKENSQSEIHIKSQSSLPSENTLLGHGTKEPSIEETEQSGDITFVKVKKIDSKTEKIIRANLEYDGYEEEDSESKVIVEVQRQTSCKDNTHITKKSDDFKKLNEYGKENFNSVITIKSQSCPSSESTLLENGKSDGIKVPDTEKDDRGETDSRPVENQMLYSTDTETKDRASTYLDDSEDIDLSSYDLVSTEGSKNSVLFGTKPKVYKQACTAVLTAPKISKNRSMDSKPVSELDYSSDTSTSLFGDLVIRTSTDDLDSVLEQTDASSRFVNAELIAPANSLANVASCSQQAERDLHSVTKFLNSEDGMVLPSSGKKMLLQTASSESEVTSVGDCVQREKHLMNYAPGLSRQREFDTQRNYCNDSPAWGGDQPSRLRTVMGPRSMYRADRSITSVPVQNYPKIPASSNVERKSRNISIKAGGKVAGVSPGVKGSPGSRYSQRPSLAPPPPNQTQAQRQSGRPGASGTGSWPELQTSGRGATVKDGTGKSAQVAAANDMQMAVELLARATGLIRDKVEDCESRQRQFPQPRRTSRPPQSGIPATLRPLFSTTQNNSDRGQPSRLYSPRLQTPRQQPPQQQPTSSRYWPPHEHRPPFGTAKNPATRRSDVMAPTKQRPAGSPGIRNRIASNTNTTPQQPPLPTTSAPRLLRRQTSTGVEAPHQTPRRCPSVELGGVVFVGVDTGDGRASERSTALRLLESRLRAGGSLSGSSTSLFHERNEGCWGEGLHSGDECGSSEDRPTSHGDLTSASGDVSNLPETEKPTDEDSSRTSTTLFRGQTESDSDQTTMLLTEVVASLTLLQGWNESNSIQQVAAHQRVADGSLRLLHEWRPRDGGHIAALPQQSDDELVSSSQVRNERDGYQKAIPSPQDDKLTRDNDTIEEFPAMPLNAEQDLMDIMRHLVDCVFCNPSLRRTESRVCDKLIQAVNDGKEPVGLQGCQIAPVTNQSSRSIHKVSSSLQECGNIVDEPENNTLIHSAIGVCGDEKQYEFDERDEISQCETEKFPTNTVDISKEKDASADEMVECAAQNLPEAEAVIEKITSVEYIYQKIEPNHLEDECSAINEDSSDTVLSVMSAGDLKNNFMLPGNTEKENVPTDEKCDKNETHNCSKNLPYSPLKDDDSVRVDTDTVPHHKCTGEGNAAFDLGLSNGICKEESLLQETNGSAEPCCEDSNHEDEESKMSEGSVVENMSTMSLFTRLQSLLTDGNKEAVPNSIDVTDNLSDYCFLFSTQESFRFAQECLKDMSSPFVGQLDDSNDKLKNKPSSDECCITEIGKDIAALLCTNKISCHTRHCAEGGGEVLDLNSKESCDSVDSLPEKTKAVAQSCNDQMSTGSETCTPGTISDECLAESMSTNTLFSKLESLLSDSVDEAPIYQITETNTMAELFFPPSSVSYECTIDNVTDTTESDQPSVSEVCVMYQPVKTTDSKTSIALNTTQTDETMVSNNRDLEIVAGPISSEIKEIKSILFEGMELKVASVQTLSESSTSEEECQPKPKRCRYSTGVDVVDNGMPGFEEELDRVTSSVRGDDNLSSHVETVASDDSLFAFIDHLQAAPHVARWATDWSLDGSDGEGELQDIASLDVEAKLNAALAHSDRLTVSTIDGRVTGLAGQSSDKVTEQLSDVLEEGAELEEGSEDSNDVLRGSSDVALSSQTVRGVMLADCLVHSELERAVTRLVDELTGVTDVEVQTSSTAVSESAGAQQDQVAPLQDAFQMPAITEAASSSESADDLMNNDQPILLVPRLQLSPETTSLSDAFAAFRMSSSHRLPSVGGSESQEQQQPPPQREPQQATRNALATIMAVAIFFAVYNGCLLLDPT